MKKANKYYAYRLANGTEGICGSWGECEKIVKGREARYRGFSARTEAEDWLRSGALYQLKPRTYNLKPVLASGIYFDAGTGRGNGVEISVTDERGENLLHMTMPKSKLNVHGKHELGKEVTNNYGELLACRQALKLALKKKIHRVFGDSKLVIDFWSKGIIKRKDLPKATVKLSDQVVKLRREFESAGGELGRISGDDNPADLGFH
ncbi:MAG: viroplasmin family protein [Patescibacteria group bacterium]|nr:viroplasmin family protein [Patescibacteria group bacterium]